MASDFKTAQPLEYYKHFLKENIRPDGRALSEFRKTMLNIGTITTACGSAVLKLGNTMVVCGIKAELAEPTPENPNKGFFVPNVELPPLCSPEFRPGPPDEKAQVISQLAADVATNSGFVNLEELCIQENKLVWVIYADVMCMSHDGNLIDAVMTVIYAALQNAKFPLIRLNEDSEEIEHVPDSTFQLNLLTRPVSTTIAIFDNDVLLVDPSQEEETLSSGTITVVIGNDKQLYLLYKPGGKAVNDKTLQQCIEAAVTRHKEVSRLLDEVHEEVER